MKERFIKILAELKIVGVIFLICGLLGAIYTFLEPIEYTASSKVIIIQDYQSGTDPYVLSGASKYLGLIFVEVISTNSFADQVIASDEKIDKNFFAADNRSQSLKKWKQTVDAELISDTGIIQIEVGHPSKEQALLIAQAATNYLSVHHGEFHGAGNQVKVRAIDQPIVSQTKPDLIFNLAIAIGVASLASLWWLGGFNWFFKN